MADQTSDERLGRDPERPVYVISVAAELVRVHPRTLRIYELEGLICPARTRSNIRLYSEKDIRRVLWIRHLTHNLGVNLAGVRVLFALEERLGMRILETLYENRANDNNSKEFKGKVTSDVDELGTDELGDELDNEISTLTNERAATTADR